MFKTDVTDENGKVIELTNAEASKSLRLMEMCNALGYDIPITTLTAISKSIVEQKFFEIDIFEYLPIRVGNGAFSDQILTYRDYSIAGDFETGIINTGANNSRLAEADTGVDSVTNKIFDWAEKITWSFTDLMKAAKSGNWDVVAGKERARKKIWDLGIQKMAFLGLSNGTSGAGAGLLTQSAVNSNTSLITGYIKAMNAAGFSALVQGLVEAYRSNAVRTAYPNRFVIPEADWNGLANLVPGTVGTYPVKMITYLEEMFKDITRKKDFKILPCAYCDEVNNALITGLNKNRYALYNYDEDSVALDIPVDYTNTMQNTINGYQFENVGYGEFTGALAFRPLEMLYFDFAT